MIPLGKIFRKTLNEQFKTPEQAEEHEADKKSSIEKLFENFNGEYQAVDADFGKPVGKEIL